MRTKKCTLVQSIFSAALMIVAMTTASAAQIVNFGTLAADPFTWGVNVFLDQFPIQYGSLGLSRTPFFQGGVTSALDIRSDTRGSRTGRAILTPSNFDLGVQASTSTRGAVVEAAAVAATGYFISGLPVESIPGTVTIRGQFRGTPNQGGLSLQFFLTDYHYFSSPRDPMVLKTYVEMLASTQSTIVGTTPPSIRPPLNFDKQSCFFGPPITLCQVDIPNTDFDYGSFSTTIPFWIAPTTGNGIIAELFAQAFSSTGEEETVDFLATASLSLDPPPGVTVTLATGQTFGAPADSTPPTTVATVSRPPNAAGWNKSDVTVTLTATDNEGGSGVKNIHFSLSGAQSESGDIAGNLVSVPVSHEGIGTLTYFATDNAGNAEAPRTLVVRIDKTPPVVSGLPAPGCTIWPPDHSMVTVGTVTAIDGLSGLAPGSPVVTATSNEPPLQADSGQTSTDIVITATTVALRAERSATGSGRVYTITASASDVAGNATAVTAVCTVPHDQRH